MALSVTVFEEYREVLYRPKTLKETGFSRKDMEKVLEFIAFIGVGKPIDYLWRPNLKGEIYDSLKNQQLSRYFCFCCFLSFSILNTLILPLLLPFLVLQQAKRRSLRKCFRSYPIRSQVTHRSGSR